MKNQSYTCDRCKKPGEGEPPMQANFYEHAPYKKHERHLCEGCVLAMLAWIDAGVTS